MIRGVCLSVGLFVYSMDRICWKRVILMVKKIFGNPLFQSSEVSFLLNSVRGCRRLSKARSHSTEGKHNYAT